MNLKKLISGASVATLAFFGAVSASSFNDIAGHWVETGGYLDTAIEKGIIDGTKPSFHPNDSITRAALTKMVAVYDNDGEEITSDDYTAPAGFSDVPADAWYYDIVNYAAESDIIDGTKDTFEPGRPVNRAEAIKVIALALQVPSVDVTLPFTDVPADAWFAPYVKSAYGNCVVKSADKFHPGWNVTRAAAVKMFVKSITPGCETVVPTPSVSGTPAPTTTATATPVATGSTTPTPTPVVTTDATVEVVVSQNSPASQSIPQNAYQVPFIALDITASDDEDLLLTGLTLQHTGLGDANEVKNLQVFEGVTPRGSDKNFSGEDDIATINLQGDPVVIPAGATKTVYVKGDIQATEETAGEHAVALLSSDSVTLVGKDTGAVVKTTGSFPIVGETMKVANIEIGDVTVTLEKPSDTSVSVGQKDVEVARFKVRAGSAEDVYVSTLTLNTTGDLDDGDVENFYVEVDGERISNIVAKSENDKVTFLLTEKDPAGFLIADGSDRTFVVKADFTGPIDKFHDDAFGVYIDESSDITVTGAKYGFGVQKTLNGVAEVNVLDSSVLNSPYLVDVDGGDITFTLDSTATDIAEDTDGIVFGTLTIVNRAEPIEIDKNGYRFELITNSSESSDDLQNIKLVSVKNNATVLGTVDSQTVANCTSDCTQVLDWNEDIYVDAGETAVFKIVADTKDNLVENSTYKFKFLSSTSTGSLKDIKVTGQVSDETTGFDIKPAGTLSTKNYTLQEAGVTVTNKALQSDTYVASTQGAVVWNGTLRADNVKDISIERLEFAQEGSANSSDLNSYTIQAKVDGAWVNVESGKDVTDTFTFSGLDELPSHKFIIGKGDEVEIRVLADVADDVTANHTVKLKLTSLEFQEVNLDGTYGDTTVVSSTTTPALPSDVTGAVFTLVDKGTVSVTLDNADTPNSEDLIAGTTDNTVAVYKVKADDEDVSINDVTVSVTDASFTEGLTGTSITPDATVSVNQITEGVAATADTATITLEAAGNIGPADKFVLKDGGGNEIASVTGCDGASRADVVSAFAGTVSASCTRTPEDNLDLNGYTLTQKGTTGEDALVLLITKVGATGTPSLVREVSDLNDIFTATPFTSTSAVAQVQKVTIGGTVVGDDEFALTVAGASVSYTAEAGDTPETVAAKLAALVSTDTVAPAIETVSVSGSVITLTSAKDTTADTTDNSKVVVTTTTSLIDHSSITAALPTNAKDAVRSVSLYNGTTLLDTVTLDTDGKAVFEDLGFVVEAGETTDLTVKVDLNNIGTNTSDTAQSGHVFTTQLFVNEAKGTESGDIVLTDPTNTSPIASSSKFLVTNNKLQVSKTADQSTTLAGTTADLLKFRIFDASADGDNAAVKVLTFDVAATGNAAAPTNGSDYTVSGGSQTPTCSDLDGTKLVCTFAIPEEISSAGTTFVLKATGGLTPGTDSSITTKLVVNSVAPATTEGVTWIDGGDGSQPTANGAQVQWIDFGEADEATTYILNTVSN